MLSKSKDKGVSRPLDLNLIGLDPCQDNKGLPPPQNPKGSRRNRRPTNSFWGDGQPTTSWKQNRLHYLMPPLGGAENFGHYPPEERLKPAQAAHFYRNMEVAWVANPGANGGHVPEGFELVAGPVNTTARGRKVSLDAYLLEDTLQDKHGNAVLAPSGNPVKRISVAFGASTSSYDWRVNAEQMVRVPLQYLAAAQFVERLVTIHEKEHARGEVYFEISGHSLGGGLAAFARLANAHVNRMSARTFNAAGLSRNVRKFVVLHYLDPANVKALNALLGKQDADLAGMPEAKRLELLRKLLSTKPGRKQLERRLLERLSDAAKSVVNVVVKGDFVADPNRRADRHTLGIGDNQLVGVSYFLESAPGLTINTRHTGTGIFRSLSQYNNKLPSMPPYSEED